MGGVTEPVAGYQDFIPRRRFRGPRFHGAMSASPGGSQVAYVDDTAGQFKITVQALEGGPVRRLTSLVDAAVRKVVWHPSGQSLIFQADVGGAEKLQLFEVGVDGGEPRTLTDVPTASFSLAFGPPVSPDERHLAYSGNDRTRAAQDVRS